MKTGHPITREEITALGAQLAESLEQERRFTALLVKEEGLELSGPDDDWADRQPGFEEEAERTRLALRGAY